MYPHLPSPVNFREDINGLRAWAVIAVLFFHFSLFDLSGGFAGVDVFFVISGYLMTAIIVGGFEKGNFSIGKFYMARIRRILPALMTVIAVLLLLGWFFLPSFDYKTLSIQSFYALNFTSNMYFLRTAGYFDSVAEEKWLLHTWSLAVEAQFYLLYPLIIALIWRISNHLKTVTLIIAALLILSFATNLLFVEINPTAAFYSLPSRGWELFAGGLVYLIAKQYVMPSKLLDTLYWLGWTMVISSFFLITETLAWPGLWAMIPVLGTSFIILASKQNMLMTNNPVAQWLGDRSYSLYLWHWPLVVGLYFASLHHEWLWVIGFFGLSLVLAHLSYRFIETPTRKFLSRTTLIKEITIIGFIGLCLAGFSASIKFFDFKWRLDNPEISKVEDNAQKQWVKNNANLDSDIVLLGDSHAGASAFQLKEQTEKHLQSFSTYNQPGCPMIKDVIFTDFGMESKRGASCQNYVDKVLDKDKLNRVVILNRLPYYFNGPNEKEREVFWGKPLFYLSGMEPSTEFTDTYRERIKDAYIDTVCEIKSRSKSLYLMRPIPEVVVNVPNTLVRDVLFNRAKTDIKITLDEYFQRNNFVWEMQNEAQKQCGVKILNPIPYLCDETFCYGSKDGYPLYSDDNHLSAFGNKQIAPVFDSLFK